MSDNEFEAGVSSGENITLEEAGRMMPGKVLMMKDVFPCKVTAFATAKPGKHGSAKAMVTAKDIFTDKQYEETFGTGDMIPAPIVTKQEYQLLDLDEDEGNLTLMDLASGEMKEDLNLPTANHMSDVCKEIKRIQAAQKKECLVTIQTWGDKQAVYSVREGAEM